MSCFSFTLAFWTCSDSVPDLSLWNPLKWVQLWRQSELKTSLEDSPKSWINLNIMSWSVTNFVSENRRRVLSCSHSTKYNYICKREKRVLTSVNKNVLFFCIFFFNLFGFSLGLFSVSLTNPRIMTQAGVSGKSLTFKTDPEFLCFTQCSIQTYLIVLLSFRLIFSWTSEALQSGSAPGSMLTSLIKWQLNDWNLAVY